MAAFAGYDMPINYTLGILKEHRHTRSKAGLFDVSHMGQIILAGEDVSKDLEAIVCSDVRSLKEGQMQYSLLVNEDGGIIDDLMISKYQGNLFLVVNASRKNTDFDHITKCLGKQSRATLLEGTALLALQGPHAKTIIENFCPEAESMAFMTVTESLINDIPCIISRSGYTGEDGYEISIADQYAASVVDLFLQDENVQLCGLGARDTLRIEAGHCLYGNDINENISPVEAGLAWTINKKRREAKNFRGADIILKQLIDGPRSKRTGLLPRGRAPARAGTKIATLDGRTIGEITSGTFGPTYGAPIAMGYVESAYASPNTLVNLKIRGKNFPAEVTQLPFISHHYFKKEGEGK
jgi:aminomethyltransferase